jgi:hypothetical protein
MDVDSNRKESNLLKRVGITEAVGLATIPFVAYCMIFTYWAGYLSYFAIPLEFIPFNLPEVFIVGAAILGVVLSILGVANIIFTFVFPYLFPKGQIPKPVVDRLIKLSFFILVAIPVFLINPWGQVQWCLFTIILLVTLIMFAPPILRRGLKGTYLERMEAIDQKSSGDIWAESPLGMFAKWVGRWAFVGIIYLVLILNLTNGVGRATAINQRLFRVANTSPETVVIFISNDNVICAPFNRNTKQVEPVFTVLSLSGSSGVSFSLEDIGPLTLNASATGTAVITPPPPLLTVSPMGTPTQPPAVTP